MTEPTFAAWEWAVLTATAALVVLGVAALIRAAVTHG